MVRTPKIVYLIYEFHFTYKVYTNKKYNIIINKIT